MLVPIVGLRSGAISGLCSQRIVSTSGGDGGGPAGDARAGLLAQTASNTADAAARSPGLGPAVVSIGALEAGINRVTSSNS